MSKGGYCMKRLVSIILLCTLGMIGCGTNDKKAASNANAPKPAMETEFTVEATAGNAVVDYDAKKSDLVDPPDKVQSYEISVERWDRLENDFSVEVMKYGSPGSDIEECGLCEVCLAYEETLDRICKRNKEYFIKRTNYYDEDGKIYKAALYLKNNNCYILHKSHYKNEKHSRIKLVNMMLVDGLEDELKIKVPFPTYIDVREYDLEEDWEKSVVWGEKNIFNRYSFEDMKLFYKMFSKDTTVISDKEKTIKVRGTAYDFDNKQIDVWATFDFKNHKYTVKNVKGELIHSLDTMYDRLEKKYESAGTVGGIEFRYDKQTGKIFKVENKKKKEWFSGYELSDLLGAWNCCGMYIKFKLKDSKDKEHYYFDAVAHFEEDGEWVEHLTFVFDKDGEVKEIKPLK